MLTIEDILAVMGVEPTEVVECEDGFVMTFGKDVTENDDNE